MEQEFVTLPREVVERAMIALEFSETQSHRHQYDVEASALAALSAALEQPQDEQPLRYLDGGSRYKVTHMKTSGYCIIGLSGELLGRWVALVDATDNKHMDSYQQPPTTEQSSAVQQPQGEQGPVAWISPRALEWETRQSEKVVKLTCKAQPEYGFTEPLYTHSQPKREPLTDNQIDKIAESMPGGLEGFLKGWGWRQFARAVLENDHNIK